MRDRNDDRDWRGRADVRLTLALALVGLLATAAAGFGAPRFPRVTGRSPQPGAPVLLDFWASWCQPCLAEMPLVVAVARENPKLQVMLVSVDESESALRRIMRGRDGAPLVVHDPGRVWARNYAVNKYPTLILLAADGREICRVSGSLDDARLRSWLKECLPGPDGAAP